MKKWMQTGMTIALLLCLASCGKGTAQRTSAALETSGETKKEEEIAEVEEIPNPMKVVQGAEDLKEIGVSMEAPEGAEQVSFYIISDVVAEISFQKEEVLYTYRGSATAADFAGIFEEMETEETLSMTGSEGEDLGELHVRTTKSGGRLASWERNQVRYTLYTPSLVEIEEILSVCQELAQKN